MDLLTYLLIVWCDIYFDIFNGLGMNHECVKQIVRRSLAIASSNVVEWRTRAKRLNPLSASQSRNHHHRYLRFESQKQTTVCLANLHITIICTITTTVVILV